MMAFLIYFLSILYMCMCDEIKQPHIVFIVADDIGWNDVSLHGSNQIMTPNIDMIGHHGIVLENYYTDAYGTPSRSAMFTGKYPLRMGTQGVSIGVAEDRGLPVTEKLLPSYLQELGYATHLVGKWQLGKSREYFLPTYRGFDTFYGFLGSSIDYYTYNHVESCNGSEFFGLDLFNNSEPVLRHNIKHLTEVLTDEAVTIIKEHDTSVPLYLHVAHAAAHTGGGLVNLQAPPGLVAANDHIAHSARRLYAGLVTGIDNCLGEIISALAETDMLSNTMVIFVSDNGASCVEPNQNFGSNLPLRGTKGTPWEGSVRSTAVVWHNDIEPQMWKGLFHVTDWLPTLVSAVGGNVSDLIDGIDQWHAIINDENPPRSEAIIAIDDINGWGALRYMDLKLIVGNVDEHTSSFFGKELSKLVHEEPLYEKALLDSETAIVFREVLNIYLNLSNTFEKRNSCSLQNLRHNTNHSLCIPSKVKGCLFNLTADPGETRDLWYDKQEMVKQLTIRFRLLWSQIKPRRLPSFDERADPSVHGYIWYPWLDSEEPYPEPLLTPPQYPLQISAEELQYYVNSKLKIMKDNFSVYFKSMTDKFVDSVSSIF